ncbi:hypothetical protein FUAX_28370 [Fulvitalea axinellae]|uniref:Uncharacterized protein n=1 Tax=Fulvitalea axinellae TaxID=1182444 RepID=A0AAU9DH52_9BACT|nr:hypothetical protein FUAX_28370 [Fulvitalea axinellae]
MIRILSPKKSREIDLSAFCKLTYSFTHKQEPARSKERVRLRWHNTLIHISWCYRLSSSPLSNTYQV